jgi:hypothetical protein
MPTMRHYVHVVTFDTQPKRKFVISGDNPEERLRSLYPDLKGVSCHSTVNLSSVEIFGKHIESKAETN